MKGKTLFTIIVALLLIFSYGLVSVYADNPDWDNATLITEEDLSNGVQFNKTYRIIPKEDTYIWVNGPKDTSFEVWEKYDYSWGISKYICSDGGQIANLEAKKDYLLFSRSYSSPEKMTIKNCGIPTAVSFTKHGDDICYGKNGTDGYKNEKGEWVPTSDIYLKFESPFEDGDTVEVTFDSGLLATYRVENVYYLEEGKDRTECVPVNINYPNINIGAEWVNEQSYDKPFDTGAVEDYKVYIEYQNGEQGAIKVFDNTVRSARLVYGYNDDVNLEFGSLPKGKIPVIELNKKINVNLTEEEPISTYQLIPAEDGVFVFEAYGDAELVGQVRTQKTIIDKVYDYSDDYPNESNYQIAFEVEAGKTYYLQTKSTDNDNMTIQVKAYYVGAWFASANQEGNYWQLHPEMPSESLCIDLYGDVSGLSYCWYKSDGSVIQLNGISTLTVSKVGGYYCIVSDGTNSLKVDFFVNTSKHENGLDLYYDSDNTVGVYADWDDNGECLAKGDIVIPSTIDFFEGTSGIVRYIASFADAKELRSVSIPSTVTEIYSDAFINCGLHSITIPATVTRIGDAAIGYNCTYDEEAGDETYSLVPDFVIYGKTGSVAHEYAVTNGITFIDPDVKEKEPAASGSTERQELPTITNSNPESDMAKASNINKATVTAADIKKASNLGATSITLGAKVKRIKANAFKGTKIKTVTVKTKKLKAKSVKGSLKGSKVKTIKVKVGKAKENKKYVKTYKKIFTKKNVGKKVGVK